MGLLKLAGFGTWDAGLCSLRSRDFGFGLRGFAYLAKKP